ncbi:hypothetical protein NDU88_005750 [Pleurodeles waltl]|uniref:Insecticidal crystal toxin domain-containing protein n=1 Tax=Pleurodeles waltl TaxID=8319 RepID=A0AAV7QFN6_PLEWA|nr:hypothetical protein NDU88_005750 [Pleurodeles waltl]
MGVSYAERERENSLMPLDYVPRAAWFPEDKLVYAYTTQFEEIWNDRESGAKNDVSIWRPVAFQAGFFPVGDTAVNNYSPPPNAAIIVKDVGNGFVRPPSSFRVIWKDTGSGAAKDVTIYQMIPPSGYVCLGNVAVGNYHQLPNANAYRCVRSDLVQIGFLFPIWDDRGSGANADVGLWRIENNPAQPGGLTSESFISVSNYNRPSDTPYILNSNKITLPSQGDSADIALVLYQTQEMVNIWDDRGSGANRDVSFWKADHCCSLGHIAVDNYNKPSGVFAKEIKAGTLVKPTSFVQVWTDRGSGAKRDGAVWRPVCPPGYVALGYAATGNYAPPSADGFCCVKAEYVTPGQWTWVWNDRGSGARDDVSIWKASPINPEGQTLNAMSGIKRHGDMDIPAYVLKSKYVLVHNSKPTKKVVIYDVKYNFNDKKILRTEPLQLSARTKVQNCAAPKDSPPVYAERQLSYTLETESSWSFESSVEIGVTVEVSAGIPGLGDISVSSSVTTTFTVGTAGRRMESRTDSINAKVEARPKYSVDYFVTGTRYTADIPWTGKMKTIFEDDTINIENVKGEYIGVQVAEIIVTADAPIRCG